MDKFPIDEWVAASLRFTLFPAPGPVNPLNWWEITVGNAPDESSVRQSGAERQWSGVVNGLKMILTATPLRIDWVCIAPEMAGEVLPMIGSFPACLTTFGEVLFRWFANGAPAAKRLALGSTLLHAELNGDDANERLEAFLPVDLPAGPVQDLMFQINRRRASTVIPELTVNALSKWSRVRPQSVMISLVGGLPDSAVSNIDETYYSALELDVNTAAEFNGIIGAGQLAPQLNQLTAIALDVAGGVE